MSHQGGAEDWHSRNAIKTRDRCQLHVQLGSVVGWFSKIFAMQPQGPEFDPGLKIWKFVWPFFRQKSLSFLISEVGNTGNNQI